MIYCEFVVQNMGYVSPSASAPTLNPVEIWGLDNGPDEEFAHLGYDYPAELSDVTVHWREERGGPTDDKHILIAYEGDALSIGTDVAETDVVALLVADYGWPEDTTLVDGLPHNPTLS